MVRPHTIDSEGLRGPARVQNRGRGTALGLGVLGRAPPSGAVARDAGAPSTRQRAAAGVPGMRSGECPQVGPGCLSPLLPLFPVLVIWLLIELEHFYPKSHRAAYNGSEPL